MALLDFRESFAGGRNRQWYATVGASDLPTTAGIGDWAVGDIVWNLAPSGGVPARWVCSAVSSTGAPTFLALSEPRQTNLIKTVGAAYTLLSTDKIINAVAGTVTISAPTVYQAGSVYTIHATASSVTITPVSGTINGAASVTLAANANAQVYSDSTNFFTAN